MVDPRNGKYDNLPHISPGNIESFTGQLYDNVKCVKDENLISGKFKFSSGDIIYGKINPQLGKYLYATFSGLTSADAYVLNAKNEVNQKYLYTIIQTRNFFEYSVSVSMRSGMPKINRDELNVYSFFAPATDEQLKIGNCILKYDHLITLHQSKSFWHILEAIVSCTLSWEQRKVIDIAETRRGLTYKPTDISEDGIRVLRSSNINEDTFVKGEDDVFVNIKAINIPFVRNGDIIITSANGSSRLVGKHAIIREITDNSAVHGGFMLLATAKNPQFLNASMGASWYIKFINLFVAGGNGAIGNLNKNDLDEQTILVPYETEQELIGCFFENLDHLITLHQLEPFKLIFKAIAYRIIDYAKGKPPRYIKLEDILLVYKIPCMKIAYIRNINL